MLGDGIVDAADQLLPAALEQLGVGAGVQFAVCRRTDDDVGLRQQLVHHLDRAVQVVLDDVVLAFVLVGDDRRDDAPGDLIHVVGRHVQRIDDVGDGIVDTADQLLPASLEQLALARVSSSPSAAAWMRALVSSSKSLIISIRPFRLSLMTPYSPL